MKPVKLVYEVPEWYSEELKEIIKTNVDATIKAYLEKLPDVEKITVAVCKYYNSNLDEILTDDRSVEILYKRRMLFYFLYHYSGLQASHIGCLGKTKFSAEAVRHSSVAISEMIYSGDVRKDIETIRTLINV